MANCFTSNAREYISLIFICESGGTRNYYIPGCMS